MRTHVLGVAGAWLLLFAAPAHAAETAPDDSRGPVLFYRQPAREWVEALPIGNGRLGGMVFGRVAEELIQLNEDTFWSGGPYDPIHEEALQYLPQVRQLLRDGRYKEAQDLADAKLMGRPRHLQAYQPLGNLRIAVEGHDSPAEYRRELDLDRALVRVRYRAQGTLFTREVLSSAPDQSIVVRFTAEGRAKLRLAVTLDSKQPFAVQAVSPLGLLMTAAGAATSRGPRTTGSCRTASKPAGTATASRSPSGWPPRPAAAASRPTAGVCASWTARA